MLKATSKTVLVALVAGLAACGDGAVAPKSANVATPAPAGVQGALATLTMTDTVRFSFVVNPAVSQSVYLGAGNSVRFPAGSVCDPSSSYGATEWDNTCTPATAPITVSASAWLDPVSGNPRVDFATHLRFVPSTNPLQWVTLAFTDLSAAQDPSTDILYCTSAYSTCVSELQGDATLITVKNPVTGLVTRRIKHFSGYLLGSGDDCGGCTEGGAGFNRAGTTMFRMPSLTSASAKIGPMGGVLSLPAQGLTVTVPAGALSTMTTLSVSTRPGQLLSYEFQPHGTQFAVPLRVTQNLRGADLGNMSASRMTAVYFANESQVDDASGSVQATELMPVEISQDGGQASFEIHHFSGYMFATGDVCEAAEGGCSQTPPPGGMQPSFSRVGGTSAPVLHGVKRAPR